MHSVISFKSLLLLSSALLFGVPVYSKYEYIIMSSCATLTNLQVTNITAQNSSFPFVITLSPTSFNSGVNVTGVIQFSE